MIKRALQPILQDALFKGRVIVLYGPRRVGKTTLVRQIMAGLAASSRYVNCDLPDQRENLRPDLGALRVFLGANTLVVIDEAQRVPEIGLVLKIIADEFPQHQVIATGSSSFELAGQVGEPLTGRATHFRLLPFSVNELVDAGQFLAAAPDFATRMIYGSYPNVIGVNETTAIDFLDNLRVDYLYKDVLAFERLRKADLVQNLLKLLALQIGSEVSLNELATQLGVNRTTIERYLNLLEQTFVIFRVRAFSRNPRKEIAKGFKVYFYDLGIRNAVISQFNGLNLRSDVGALWENFCIVERIKARYAQKRGAEFYFWRTYAQQEVDWVEINEGMPTAYEFKWGSGKSGGLRAFAEAYPDAPTQVITPENALGFIGAG